MGLNLLSEELLIWSKKIIELKKDSQEISSSCAKENLTCPGVGLNCPRLARSDGLNGIVGG